MTSYEALAASMAHDRYVREVREMYRVRTQFGPPGRTESDIVDRLARAEAEKVRLSQQYADCCWAEMTPKERAVFDD